MACMGPTYSENEVDEIYEKVMEMLKNNYHIQDKDPHFNIENSNRLRVERNANLKNAIKLLVELDSWENF